MYARNQINERRRGMIRTKVRGRATILLCPQCQTGKHLACMKCIDVDGTHVKFTHRCKVCGSKVSRITTYQEMAK